MSITLELKTAPFQAAMKRFPAMMAQHAAQGMTQIHLAFHGEMRRLFRGGGPKSSGPRLRPEIVRGITHGLRGTTLDTLRSASIASHKAAVIQEHGGTITANGRYSVCGKGKMLAIPLGPAKTKAGFARGGPCDDPDLFMIKSKKGNLLLVKKTGKGPKAGITPYFLLKRSVTIRPGLKFFATFARVVKERGQELIGRAMRAAAQAAFGKGRS